MRRALRILLFRGLGSEFHLGIVILKLISISTRLDYDNNSGFNCALLRSEPVGGNIEA